VLFRSHRPGRPHPGPRRRAHPHRAADRHRRPAGPVRSALRRDPHRTARSARRRGPDRTRTGVTMSETRQLHLNAFLMSTGHHEASWRLPESDPHATTAIEHYRNLARIAERGRLDSVFFADSPALWGD